MWCRASVANQHQVNVFAGKFTQKRYFDRGLWRNEWGFRPPLCKYRLNWPRTLPLGHGGFPQFWIFTSEWRINTCFFETWMPERGTNRRSQSFRAGSFNHCIAASAEHWPKKGQKLVSHWLIPRLITYQNQCKILRQPWRCALLVARKWNTSYRFVRWGNWLG